MNCDDKRYWQARWAPQARKNSCRSHQSPNHQRWSLANVVIAICQICKQAFIHTHTNQLIAIGVCCIGCRTLRRDVLRKLWLATKWEQMPFCWLWWWANLITGGIIYCRTPCVQTHRHGCNNASQQVFDISHASIWKMYWSLRLTPDYLFFCA